ERPSVGYIDFVRFQSFLPVYHTAATIAFVTQVPLWANLKVGDFVQARHFNARIYSGAMPDGSIYTSTAALDPFNTANNTPKSVMETRTITANEYRVQSSGDLTINILPGLDFKTLGSVYINATKAVDFAKRSSNRDGDPNRGQFNNGVYIDLLTENTFTYNREIKKHSVNLLAGFTAQQIKNTQEQIVGLSYPSDNITSGAAGQIEQSSVDGNGNLQGTYNQKFQEGLLSYLGRVMYSYNDRYLLSASVRTDGSHKFGPGRKWGSFPSVSLGWVATKEEFMENIGWLSILKLRTSYGVVGNNRLANDFGWLDLLYAANYPMGAGTGTSTSGQAPSRSFLSNPAITWEKTRQFNTGLDVGLFKNVINFSLDVYQSETEKLLLLQSAMAFTGVPQFYNNIGKLQNRGIEFEVTSNNIRGKNFRWSTSANISHNKNKVLELGDEAFLLNQGERTELYRNIVGAPLVEFFGYKTDGVWLSQADITAAQTAGLTSALSNVFVPGGIKLVDINNDKKIDANDRTVIGSPYP
ncbi:MAG: SusC/RagA family TonB-linked outer membrane protein, partial [Bacteroidota bacterium]